MKSTSPPRPVKSATTRVEADPVSRGTAQREGRGSVAIFGTLAA
ncbi:MAG: hypothetical protein R3A52_14290 [Polyangiales bacterium]